MKLAMFDIDGTLIRSNDLDNRSYLQALHEVFGFSEILNDWTFYSHVTDACIFQEVFQHQLGRSPSPQELEIFQKRFLQLIIQGAETEGGIKAVSGASAMLNRLLASSDFKVAYASGGWKASAAFKLRSANLPIDRIPCAFSDDSYSREGIMEIALFRAEKSYGQSFAKAIYIGDGAWDVRSAQNLGYGFIGIASGNQAEILFSEGATHVFSSYDDCDNFLMTLVAKAQQLSNRNE